MLHSFIFGLLILAATTSADSESSNYTVTHEAWFEFEVQDLDGPGEHYTGKITIALFGETAPMTVLNFVSIAKGYDLKGKTLHYKGTKVHRIVPDFVVQMGDVNKGDGSGGVSIFGKRFNDEPFILSHRAPGYVAMANHGPDTNNSQFFILLSKARWLDSFHVVFGKVIKGYDTLKTLGEVPSNRKTGVPLRKVVITDSGAKQLATSYELSPEQQESTEDL